MKDDLHNVPLDEVAVELEIPVEKLQEAIDNIRKRRGLNPGEPLQLVVSNDRITPAKYLQKLNS